MAVARKGIADALGVPPEHIEGDLKIRPPEDPAKAQRTHDRELLVLRIAWSLAAGAIALAAFLCWLFLYDGRPEEAKSVVTTVVGLIGGLGLGKLIPAKE